MFFRKPERARTKPAKRSFKPAADTTLEPRDVPAMIAIGPVLTAVPNVTIPATRVTTPAVTVSGGLFANRALVNSGLTQNVQSGANRGLVGNVGAVRNFVTGATNTTAGSRINFNVPNGGRGLSVSPFNGSGNASFGRSDAFATTTGLAFSPQGFNDPFARSQFSSPTTGGTIFNNGSGLSASFFNNIFATAANNGFTSTGFGFGTAAASTGLTVVNPGLGAMGMGTMGPALIL